MRWAVLVCVAWSCASQERRAGDGCGAGSSGSVVMVVDKRSRGYKDRMAEFEFAAELAGRLGARIVLPRPCDALSPVHNGGVRVNCSFDWGRYRSWTRLDTGESILGVRWFSTSGLDVVKDRGSFSREFADARRLAERGTPFLWRLRENMMKQKRAITESATWRECAPSARRKRFGASTFGAALASEPSPLVADLASRFLQGGASLAFRAPRRRPPEPRARAPWAPFAALHLRRGDNAKKCDTNVAAVRAYVDCVLDETTPIVVFTDERDPRYLDQLARVLKGTTRRAVVFGDRELRNLATPSERDDNYLIFAASMVVRATADVQLALDRNSCDATPTDCPRDPPP